MVGSNFGIGLGERGLSLFPSRPSDPGAHVVTGLTPDLTDAATREANTAAIARAINTVGAAGGGTVYIPPGHYYLQQKNVQQEAPAIQIAHDNIRLLGAGIGKTVLHTRSDYSVSAGRVVRGHGIRIYGTENPSAPRHSITLENFELDGGAGHTGNYDWPANPSTGDGWDITHKGIIPSWDDHVDDVTIRDVYVHSYRGEVIYAGGWNLKAIRLQRVHSRDSNASVYNVVADDVSIEDCLFGDSRFWFEIANTNVSGSTVVRRCTFYNSHVDGAIAFADMAGTNSYLFEDNTFFGTRALIGCYGGFGLGIYIELNENYFEGGGRAIIQVVSNYTASPNRNITFRNNIVLNSPFLLDTLGWLEDSLIDENDFTGTAGNSSLERHCCNTINNVVVSNNIHRNTLESTTRGPPSTGAPKLINNKSASPVSDTEAPSTPTGLTALAGSHPDVLLRWVPSTDSVGVSGYRVYRDTVQVAEVPGPWHMDTGLAPATEYTYAVSAYDFAGNESGQSRAVNVTTDGR